MALRLGKGALRLSGFIRGVNDIQHPPLPMEQLTIPQVGFHVGVEQDIKSSNPIEQLTNL